MDPTVERTTTPSRDGKIWCFAEGPTTPRHLSNACGFRRGAATPGPAVPIAYLATGEVIPLLCLTSLPILLASMWIYRKNGFYFVGGGIELPVLWAFAQVAQIFLGAGAFRLPLPGWLRLWPVFATLL
jgi:hypothetical protein